MHRSSDRFWKCFYKLPESVRKQASESFKLLKSNPAHHSLHFKKVGKFWSSRMGLNYRALSFKDGEDFIWVWIGNHDEYLQMIKKNE